MNCPRPGLPKGLPRPQKAQVEGLPIYGASLLGRFGKPVRGVGKPYATGPGNPGKPSRTTAAPSRLTPLLGGRHRAGRALGGRRTGHGSAMADDRRRPHRPPDKLAD